MLLLATSYSLPTDYCESCHAAEENSKPYCQPPMSMRVTTVLQGLITNNKRSKLKPTIRTKYKGRQFFI